MVMRREVSVFGASGFIGSYLCDALARRKDLRIGRYSRREITGFSKWEILDPPLGHDVSIYMSSESDRLKVDEQSVESSRSALSSFEALVRSTQRFVYISSCAVTKAELSNFRSENGTDRLELEPYVLKKQMHEKIVIDNGGLVLRLANVYGLSNKYRGTITEDIRKQCFSDEVSEISLRDPTVSLNLIDIQSVIELLSNSIQNDVDGTYNVASSQPFTGMKLLEIASEVSGKPISKSLNCDNGKPRLLAVENFDVVDAVRDFCWQPRSQPTMLRSYFARKC